MFIAAAAGAIDRPPRQLARKAAAAAQVDDFEPVRE
jgi:hypothetical protein